MISFNSSARYMTKLSVYNISIMKHYYSWYKRMCTYDKEAQHILVYYLWYKSIYEILMIQVYRQLETYMI